MTLNKLRVFFTTIFIIAIILSIFSPLTAADDFRVFINGQKVKDSNKLLKEDGYIYIQARLLAKKLGAELKWFESIKSLELKKGDNFVKMMVNNPYLQINDTTIKTENGLIIRDGHTYLPLKKVVEAFNYIVTYENQDRDIYIFKPETLVKSIKLKQEGQKIIIDLNHKTSYQVTKMNNSKKLLVEIKRGALSGDFIDGISGDNYNLKINRSKDKVYLQFIIEADSPIPFDQKNGVKVSGNDLVINLMPHIKKIQWTDNNELEVLANGKINEPEISYLENPRRMVLDFPSLMLSEFDVDLKEVDWIKDVRVSQFKYDPMVLRVVLELDKDYYLEIINNDIDNMVALQPTGITEIRKLAYSNGKISFESDKSVEPEFFKLTNPDRLVINLVNARKSNDLNEEIVVDNKTIKKIRCGKFNEETVRIVADLKEKTDYQLKKKSLNNGYKYLIYLNNNINRIEISKKQGFQDININFAEKVEYEVKKFSYPHRIVVDVKGVEIDKGKVETPTPKGIIKDVRIGNYEQEGLDVVRAVFELENFYGYKLISDNPASKISLNIMDKKGAEINNYSNLIVIDPGHGGFDPGAIGPTGLKEKDVNLEIARKVYDKMKEAGYEVFLTREKDKFISLSSRVEMAQEKNAGLFISIHINASKKSYTQGTETFVAKDCTNKDMKLAELVQARLIKKLKLENRGIRKDNFYVIRNTSMPSALVEVAFLSNPHEESLLSNELFREKAARAITEGLKKYMDNKKLEDESSHD